MLKSILIGDNNFQDIIITSKQNLRIPLMDCVAPWRETPDLFLNQFWSYEILYLGCMSPSQLLHYPSAGHKYTPLISHCQ